MKREHECLSLAIPIVRIGFQPLNCEVEALIEGHLFFPTERFDEGTGDGTVSLLCEGSCVDMDEDVLCFCYSLRLKFAQEALGDTDHGQFVQRSNIVNRFRFSTTTNQIDGANDIVDVEIMPSLCPVAVNFQWFTSEQTLDKGWNDFFHMLPRSVDVAQTNDAVGKFKAFTVGFDEKLRRGYRGSVGIEWIEKADFLAAACRCFTVHLVGTDMNEPLNSAIDPTCFENGVSSVDIRFRERDAIAERIIKVGLH